jgi:hypothetical protein
MDHTMLHCVVHDAGQPARTVLSESALLDCPVPYLHLGLNIVIYSSAQFDFHLLETSPSVWGAL